MLPHEVAFALAVNPSEMDRALALDEPNDLRDRVFGRDRDHHVDVIDHQMPLQDFTFLLPRQPLEYFAQMRPQPDIERLSPELRDEHDVIFAVPSRVT